MELSAALPFLRSNHRAVLVTHRSDGGMQTSPIVFALDANGKPTISSRETAYKVKNLRRDPRASLCVINDEFFGEWKQVDGTASIVSLPEAMDGLVECYRAVAGEHPDWDEYRAAMERDRRCLIQIDIHRVGPDRSG